MQFRVFVEGTPAFACSAQQSVLQAMQAASQSTLPVGCRSGGCGVCRVQIVSGDYDAGHMSSAQVDADERAQGIALACQVFPRSDLKLRPLRRKSGCDATSALLRSVGQNNQARTACP